MDITQVRSSRAYHVLIVVGLASYGLLHLVLAWLALQVAFGKKGDASQQGALKQLAGQPLGVALLWVMAVGLFTIAVWQGLQAVIGLKGIPDKDQLRRRASSAGRAIVYVALGVLAIGVATGSSSASGKTEETVSAKLMAVPFGQVLVGAIGLAVLGVGIAQVTKGVRQRFTEDLSQGVSTAVRRLGTIGYTAKGIALAVIGGLFGYAAITYDPKKAGGMDAALTTVRGQPFGEVMLIALAIGFACFGVFCFFWARQPRY